MCRHLAWLGAPRTLASLVLEPEHGLLRQSYQPRRQRRGLMNADGWGVGYFSPGLPAPARWRSDRPLWSAASFHSVAPTISSGAVLAAVRSATVGMPADETASAPFTDGTWLLSHNGVVDRTALPPSREAESACDSALLAAHVFAERAFDGPALGDLLRKVAAADPAASLNLLLTDGARVLATTWADPAGYLVLDDADGGAGVVVASEPWDDDPRWVDVPDRHLIEATPEGVVVTPLEDTP